MSLFVGLAVAAGLAGLALGVRPSRPVAVAVAVAALLGLALVVVMLPADVEVLVGDVPVRATPFARLWAIATCVASAALVVLGGISRVAPSAGPLAVLVVVLCALSFLAPAAPAAILLATGGGIAAAALVVAPPFRASIDSLRTVAAAAVAAAAGAALATGPARAEPVAFSLGGAAVVVAAALRAGVAPLHGTAVRVAEATPLALAPLAVAFAPAAFVAAAQAALAIAEPGAGGEPLALAVAIRAAAVAGVALAAAGLLLQTDLERALPYALSVEGAFALLAFANTSDDTVAAALRTRLLVTPLAAATAWGAVSALRLDPAHTREGLAGWARRAPLLALALGAAALALFGWPGSASWAARETIAVAAFGPVLGVAALVASATPTVFALVRALVVGSAASDSRAEATPRVRQARRRDQWRIPLGAALAVGLAILGVAVAGGAGDVAGAAVLAAAVR